MNSLFQKEKIYGRGVFLFLPQSVPASQDHCHLYLGVDNTVEIKLLRWCRFSGVEMTGKFRKVASHSAPEPDFGLFLNLPEGSAPGTPARQWRKYSCEMSTEHSYGTLTD